MIKCKNLKNANAQKDTFQNISELGNNIKLLLYKQQQHWRIDFRQITTWRIDFQSSESLRLWAGSPPPLCQCVPHLNKSHDVTADGSQPHEGRVSFRCKNVLLPNKRGQAASQSRR